MSKLAKIAARLYELEEWAEKKEGRNIKISPEFAGEIADAIMHHLTQRRVDLDGTTSVNDVLKIVDGIKIADVIRSVSSDTCVSVEDILSPERGIKEIADARHMVVYIANRKLKKSQTEIGAVIKRDHTSVFNSIRKVEGRPELIEHANEIFADMIGALEFKSCRRLDIAAE